MKKFGRRFSITLGVCLAILAGLPALPPALASRSPRADSQTNALGFESITVEQGLSLNTVTAVLQDQQGFMWFATEDGLNKYDGYQFTMYKRDLDDPQTLSDSYVWTIYQDRGGDLWVGTKRGLDRLDRTTETFVHYLHDPDDPASLSGVGVLSIYEDRAGPLWVGTEDGGLNQLDRATDTFSHYRHAPGDAGTLSDDQVWAIYQDRQGELWIGTNDGLDRFDQATGTFDHYGHDPGEPMSLGGNKVRVIYEDEQGALWIGTQGAGLDQFDRSSGTFTHHRHERDDPHSLSHDSVRAILQDRAGRLWVGTQNGLDQLVSQNRFVHFRHDPNDPHSLGSDWVASIYEDRSGVLWIGTGGGGLSKHNPAANKFALYRHHPDFPVDASLSHVSSVYEDQGGDLWIGTLGGGLNRLDRESDTLAIYQHDPANANSLSSNEVRAVLGDRAGNLWVGTWNGGLNRLDRATGSFVRYQYAVDDSASLSNNFVLAIYEDQAGALWVGTWGGINLWNSASDQFGHYAHNPDDPSSLSNDAVLSFYEDAAGMMWIGTWGGGLNRFDPTTQTFSHYTEKDGLPNDVIYGILADAGGYLWLSTNKGLSKFDPRAETFRNYGVNDGLQGDAFDVGAYFQSASGEMSFGGPEGLNAFRPEQVQDNPHLPPIVVTAFKKLNQTARTDLAAGERLQLSHRDNFISFEFAALDYGAPGKNQYAYMMEGLDEDWVDAGTRRYAEYRNLRPGDYVFRVKGSNSDGVWNQEGVAVYIAVTPPLWETWWFRGIALLALAGVAVGGYRLRVRNIEARSRKLETQVEQRTAELRQEVEQRVRVEEAMRQSEMEKAVAAERSRLARELHDAVTQTLFSANLVADALPVVWEGDQEEGRELLKDLRQLTRGAMAEMRTLLLELRPAALVEADLGDLLRQLAQAASGREGIPVTVAAQGEIELPPDVHVALYRMAQEALNNVVKHARASQVVVSLHCDGPPWMTASRDEGQGTKKRRVELRVSDDGCGFDPDDGPSDRMGLGIMRERAQAIGAALTVKSQPGQGTEVAVRWEKEKGE